jgi:benzoylformate decarboxylase
VTATEQRAVVSGTPVVHALLDTLVAWGVDRIFCCPGSTEAALLDALVTRDDVALVLVTHESVAVAAAEGQARLTGTPAVAYLHTHVGMANAVAHLVSAQLAHVPVVVLNGLKPAALAGRGGFTTAPYPRDLVRQHVRWAWQSVCATDVPGDLDRALHAAVVEPAGPVWLGLPQDLLESPVAAAPVTVTARTAARTRPGAEAVDAAASALRAALRPVLVAGSEVARQAACPLLVRLAETLAAPVLHEDRRDFQRSAFPSAHPHHLGLYSAAHPAVADADVVLFAGARLFTEFDLPGATPDLPPGATVLHAHVDAAEVGRLRPVDVGLVGDLRETLTDLLAALDGHTPTDPGRVPALRAGAGRLSAGAGPASSGAAGPSGGAGAGGPAGPGVPAVPGHRRLGPVAAAIAAGLDPAATVVLDATTASVALLGALPLRSDRTQCSISGSLGWGMGAALGVAFARPGKPVVALIGDGVFQFGIQALWTARRYRLPVTFVVLDNRAYGAVASALSRFGGAAAGHDSWPGTDIGGPDLAAVAAGFGLTTHRITGADGLTDALREAQRSPEPTLLNVSTA